MIKLSRNEKFKQMDKEAIATFIASMVIFIYFWLTIFLFKNSIVYVCYMPLWFVLSCIGGYILSCIIIIILVKFFMKNFSLED